MNIEEEVDRLFQLPLHAFTAARNALAKRVGGDESAAVRGLQKPNVAAWGVNQLYWKRRRNYDELVAAAERLRSTHRSLLAGKPVDLQAAEAAHRSAVRAAQQEIGHLLADAGESQSAANLTAIGETLEALPSAEETPGRLTRPLKRLGFEALAGVSPRPAGAPVRKLALVKPREKAPPKPEIPDATRREIGELERRLLAARSEERQSKVEVERARRELQRAEASHERLAQELEEAAEKVRQRRTDLAAREKAHKSAAAALAAVEERLESLRRE